MNIAVIGAGVSGLYAAYLLAKGGAQVTVFDSSNQIGGAMQTLKLDLGGQTRWADMGVNDFNKTQYPLLTSLLDQFGVPYLPLSDTASFYKPDGSVCYTLDGDWNTPMPANLSAEYQRFMSEAPEVLTNPQFASFTVEQYLSYRNYSTDFARFNIYPRINGMYFAHDSTPATMPIRGVMHYYTFQEGFGGPPPQRMYFAKGTSSWADALATRTQQAGAKFVVGTNAQISAGTNGVIVHTAQGDQKFDSCIMACHASTCLQLFRDGITQGIASVLSAFEYTNSVAVAHTFAPVLPPNKSAWRTYNILIHDQYQQLRPYTITYVVNQHQNDMANPAYNHFDEPQYFVSLNPPQPIPDSCVLQTIDPVPQPAVSFFPHNVFNLGAMAAQAQLPSIQGQNGVYFCGGWTLGAGLQEECLHSAQSVASGILSNASASARSASARSASAHSASAHHAEHHYDSSGEAENYAPQYVRNAVNR